MNWIRTYDFKWINLSFVSVIFYLPVYLPDTELKEIIGYKIFLESPEGTVMLGCLIDEDDVFDCMDAIIAGKQVTHDPCSEEEIREIYLESKK